LLEERSLLPGLDRRSLVRATGTRAAAFARRAGYEVIGVLRETTSDAKLDRIERRKVIL
jgi:hypothetical protein